MDTKFQFSGYGVDRAVVEDFVPSKMANDMVCPCEGCPLAQDCAVKVTECSAFRHWSEEGRWTQRERGRYLRAMKD